MPKGYPKSGVNTGRFKPGTPCPQERKDRLAAQVGEANPFFGKRHSPEARERMSIAAKARGMDHLKGQTIWSKGKKFTPEHRRKLAEAGRNRYAAKTGFLPFGNPRKCVEYKIWRESVFLRDNYTCQECGARNYAGLGKTVRLEAHHVKSLATHPEMKFSVPNGQTLCRACHLKTPSIGRPKRLHSQRKKRGDR